jgi:hypothetical protein
MSDGGNEAAPPAWPRVIKLEHPVTFGTERITELTFRRGRLGDLKGMKLGETIPADHLVLVASRLSCQPVPVIEMLEGNDAGEAMDIALDFFTQCLGAGKKR